MQHAMINGESLEYSVQGSNQGEDVVLIHGERSQTCTRL
jgi:hypothetical protein